MLFIQGVVGERRRKHVRGVIAAIVDWSWSSSVRVRPILDEHAPEHQGSVRPVVTPEPEPQGSGSAGSVRVRTRVHLGSGCSA